jgi:hypothetical protein
MIAVRNHAQPVEHVLEFAQALRHVLASPGQWY